MQATAMTTTSGLLAASAVVVLGAWGGVSVDTFTFLASGSMSGAANSPAKQQPSDAAPCNSGNGNGNGNGNCSPGSANKTFTVAGNITGLTPGVQRSIPLSIKNNASQAIKVRTLMVQAADARSALGVVVCPASNLLLGNPATAGSGSMATSSLTIAGGATATNVAFPVRLVSTANDSCQNVQWNLTYSGTADQA